MVDNTEYALEVCFADPKGLYLYDWKQTADNDRKPVLVHPWCDNFCNILSSVEYPKTLQTETTILQNILEYVTSHLLCCK